MNGEINPINSITEKAVKPSKGGIVKTGYESMTLAKLKIICKEKGLKGSGKKAEVIERINVFDLSVNPIISIIKDENGNNGINIDSKINNDNNNKNNNDDNDIDKNKIKKEVNINDNMFLMYNAMSLNELKDICLTKYIPDTGDKRQLIEALISDQSSQEEVIDYDFSSFYKKALEEQIPLFVASPKIKKYREIK